MKKIFGVNFNIFLLGLVSTITDTGSKMILPILPMFIKSLGGAGIAVGIVGGVSESIASLLKVFSGYFSDRIGKRKPFIYTGYALSSVAKLLMGLSSSWLHILLLKPLERVGKGLRSAPRDALIRHFSKESNIGKGFGFHRMMDSLGSVIGSIIALILIAHFNFSFASVIMAAGILSIFALLPLHFVKERKSRPLRRKLLASFSELPANLKLFIAIASLFALANFSYMFFILRAQVGFSGINRVAIPIIMYTIYQAVYTILSEPVGSASDRFGRRAMIQIGYLLFALTCFILYFMQSFAALLIAFLLYGASLAFVDAMQRAFASELAPKEILGTSMGLFHTSIGIMSLPASVIAGFLWETVSPEAVFLYGALISLLAALLLKGVKK
ncbi:MFS transporter [Candidatus Micrarchaeota archaeon]|nr:MAG: MFS transporter [Candidatus Micrarchaeota archaeon]